MGKELHYRMSRTRPERGKSETTNIDVFVRFQARPEGYAMHTRIGAPPASPTGFQQPLASALTAPIIFQVDAEGTIVGIEDEAGYWKIVEAAYDELIRSEKVPTEVQKRLKTLAAGMRELPQGERLALMAKNYAPILEFSGSEMRVGETASVENEAAIPIPLGKNTPIKRDISVTLDAANETVATFVVVTQPDPTAFKEAMQALVKLAPKDKQREVPTFKIDQRATYAVSRTTGLTQKFTESISVGADAESGSRVTILELVK
jgi:hypothetical protein